MNALAPAFTPNASAGYATQFYSGGVNSLQYPSQLPADMNQVNNLL